MSHQIVPMDEHIRFVRITNAHNIPNYYPIEYSNGIPNLEYSQYIIDRTRSNGCNFCGDNHTRRPCLISAMVYRDKKGESHVFFSCDKHECLKWTHDTVDNIACCAICAKEKPIFLFVNYLDPIIMTYFCSTECKDLGTVGIVEENIFLLIEFKFCSVCDKKVLSIKRCGRCHNKRYCSHECQVKDWQTHKLECRP